MLFTQISISLAAAVAAAVPAMVLSDSIFNDPAPRTLASVLGGALALALIALAGAAAWECSGLLLYWVSPSVPGVSL